VLLWPLEILQDTVIGGLLVLHRIDRWFYGLSSAQKRRIRAGILALGLFLALRRTKTPWFSGGVALS
jgi:hypothetical protein